MYRSGSILRVGILGFTFKENCPDTRNTKIIDIVNELKEYGVNPIITDPIADKVETKKLYGVDLVEWTHIKGMDAVILAVSHQEYLSLSEEDTLEMYDGTGGILMDIKGILDKDRFENKGYTYWRL